MVDESVPLSRRRYWQDANLGWFVVSFVIGGLGTMPDWINVVTPDWVGPWLEKRWPRFPWYAWVITALAVLYVGAIEGGYRIAKRLERRIDALKPSGRQKSQAISDALRSYHAEGTALIREEVKKRSEHRVWKQKYLDFIRRAVADMQRLNCSDAEIHGVENVGFAPKNYNGPIADNNKLKDRFFVQLNHIALVSGRHDTTSVTQ
jgi:hypothetical protein